MTDSPVIIDLGGYRAWKATGRHLRTVPCCHPQIRAHPDGTATCTDCDAGLTIREWVGTPTGGDDLPR